jgi:hypothetical protein
VYGPWLVLTSAVLFAVADTSCGRQRRHVQDGARTETGHCLYDRAALAKITTMLRFIGRTYHSVVAPKRLEAVSATARDSAIRVGGLGQRRLKAPLPHNRLRAHETKRLMIHSALFLQERLFKAC